MGRIGHPPRSTAISERLCEYGSPIAKSPEVLSKLSVAKIGYLLSFALRPVRTVGFGCGKAENRFR